MPTPYGKLRGWQVIIREMGSGMSISFNSLASFSVVIALLFYSGLAVADANPPFQFESIKTLDDMVTFVHEHFPLGSSRTDLRRAFVTGGHATLKTNPHQPGVEKYIYDINLCNYYIWRWNVSSDYDPDGRLQQAYVNGNIVFPDGRPKKIVPKVAEEGKTPSIFLGVRPRPEAYKGETNLSFTFIDLDSNLNTTDDQFAIGGGPSRADPMDMGKLIVYIEVDLWRSIFDSDSAEVIVPNQGNCTGADKRMQSTNPLQPQ
jgi:hypothetical protein